MMVIVNNLIAQLKDVQARTRFKLGFIGRFVRCLSVRGQLRFSVASLKVLDELLAEGMA